MDISLALFSTFTVALLHTAIPSHWLCFVAVGKAQGWRHRQVLSVAALAGTIHVFVTVALGVVTRLIGRQFLDEHLLERVSGLLLMAMGLVYLTLHFLRVGHHHEHERERHTSERWAILALITAVTVSPCTAAMPFLVAAAAHGVIGILLVSGVLLVTTVGMMLLLIGVTSLGVERLHFHSFDRYEKLILGLVFGGLGALILLVPHP